MGDTLGNPASTPYTLAPACLLRSPNSTTTTIDDKRRGRTRGGCWSADAIQPEHSAAYEYDSLYRLEQVAGIGVSWGVAWTFDGWGNRLTQTPTGLATGKVGS